MRDAYDDAVCLAGLVGAPGQCTADGTSWWTTGPGHATAVGVSTLTQLLLHTVTALSLKCGCGVMNNDADADVER